MMPTAPSDTPRCPADPLDADTRAAGPLTLAVLERQARSGWERCAQQLGVPDRRRARFPAWSDVRPIVLVVDGVPFCNLGAWSRLASLAPGARARPLHVAADLLVPAEDVAPPDTRRGFLGDFLAGRRRRRRQLRSERTLDADLARWEHDLDGNAEVTRHAAAAALPDYARAAVFAAALETPVPPAWAVAVLGFGASREHPSGPTDQDDDGARARRHQLTSAHERARALLTRQAMQVRAAADPLIALLVADGRLPDAATAESLDIVTLLAVARGAELR
ncbi:MAG: hypothetical protein JWN72_245 [Thermoleophilia bacterium]|nr:hypothetical protein [Thermoleophilia bacterium]